MTEALPKGFCRCCGKPVKKYTTTVYVREAPSQYDHAHAWVRYIYVGADRPKTKQDCQRHSNQQVISVGRSKDGTVHSFAEWDGARYQDEFFCSGPCTKSFAQMAAKAHPLLRTTDYDAAMAKRKEKVKP